jgi:hypothetical protein
MARKAQITPQVENWNKAVTDLRALLPRAVQVLATNLESDDPKIQQAAALHILKAVGIYGQNLEPSKFDFDF